MKAGESLALLDASTRMVAELVRAGGLHAGADAARVIETITERARDGAEPETLVPDSYRFAVPGEIDDTLVPARRRYCLRIRGPRVTVTRGAASSDSSESDLGQPLASTRTETPPQPLAEMWRLVREKRPAIPALMALGLVIAAVGALFEVMWLRGVLEMSNVLSLREHRLATIAIVLGFIGALMLLDVAIASAVFRIGRRVETRLRAALLEKLPRSERTIFKAVSCPTWPIARTASTRLRGMPDLGARFARDVDAAPVHRGRPRVARSAERRRGVGRRRRSRSEFRSATARLLAERELRQRSHAAALSRHYLDSLLGLVPARMHSAERPLRQRTSSCSSSGDDRACTCCAAALSSKACRLLVGIAARRVAGARLRRAWRAAGQASLLLVYWTLSLPMLAQRARRHHSSVPAYRNVLARVLEPLDAPDESDYARRSRQPMRRAVASAFRCKAVEVSCPRPRSVLDDVDLTIDCRRARRDRRAIGRGQVDARRAAARMAHAVRRTPCSSTAQPLDRRATRRPAPPDGAGSIPPSSCGTDRSSTTCATENRGTIVSSIGSIIEDGGARRNPREAARRAAVAARRGRTTDVRRRGTARPIRPRARSPARAPGHPGRAVPRPRSTTCATSCSARARDIWRDADAALRDPRHRATRWRSSACS